ncbi:MAG: PorP/SprF family type IX secretion system membrane protein [Bacteroidota bacterium]
MKKLIIVLGFIPVLSIGQDIHFSQVINNPLHINPANTGGYDGYERLVLNYRSQWVTVGAPYNTFGFSFDMPVFQGKGDKAHLGLGINFFSDKAGDSRFGISQGNISVAGIVPVDKNNRLIAGTSFGIAQRSANISSLQWESQFNGQEWDPTLPSNEANTLNSFAYLDIAAGVRYEFTNTNSHFKGWDVRRASVGAAYFHANKPQLWYFSGGNETLHPKLVIHGMGEFDLPNTTFGVLPFFTYFTQGPATEVNIGTLVRMEISPGTKITGLLSESNLYFGAQMRLKDAIIPQVMYSFTSFSLGISYDINISTLKTVSRGMGGLEVSLKYHNIKGALFKQRSGSKMF